MDSSNVNKCLIQLRSEARNLKIQVKNLTTENKKLSNKIMEMELENNELKLQKNKLRQEYAKETENLKRQLTSAIKTINSMAENYEKDKHEFEVNKKKLNILEVRFVNDSQKINKLESRCIKYKETTNLLKEKAKNVLVISQKCVNDTMQRRKFSPLSQQQTTKNKTQSSFNLSRTETEKLVDSALSKIPQELQRETSSPKKVVNKSNDKQNDESQLYKRENSLAVQQMKSPQESEFVEFNVYDFTRHKESIHYHQEINNTRDTAEFGEAEPPDQLAVTVKPYDDKLRTLEVDCQNNMPIKEINKENKYANDDLFKIMNGDDSKTEKENKDLNFSPDNKPTLEEQIIDYFARYDTGDEKKVSIDKNKASSLSLHPSRLPKCRRENFSPVNSQVSCSKLKTINKTANHGLNFSQGKAHDKICLAKNLVPINLSSSLSKCDDFTYKSPNEGEFNEFMSEDHVDFEEGSLHDYIGQQNSPESVPLDERLKRYESQYARS